MSKRPSPTRLAIAGEAACAHVALRARSVATYIPRLPLVTFGDLFAGVYFYDLFLRRDSVAMGWQEYPPKYLAALAKSRGRPEIAEAIGSRGFSEVIPRKLDEDYVLGHGRACRAIVLSEDCEIDNVYGRDGGVPQGRLLLAAVTDASEEAIAALQAEPTYDRFPLPGDGTIASGIVQLRRLFMVRASDADPEHRVGSLASETADDLAASFCAYVLRQGPVAGRKNAGKLAVLLAGDGPVDARHQAIGELVAEVVNAAWLLERGGLGDISEAFEGAKPKDRAIVDLVALLEHLSGQAFAAAKAIESIRSA